ncbi:MAG TPA: hypothetical protein VMS86_10260 [Thermoanaerobaculia bacterium]|nr:hypothetical protein [Thermoanaerobaculia bacterium]
MRRVAPVLCTALVLLGISAYEPAAALVTAPPCRPCIGVRVSEPAAVAPALAESPLLRDGARFYVGWPVELDGSADPAAAEPVRAAGAVPWTIVRFRAPQPIQQNVDALQDELAELARLARAASAGEPFQISWQPSAGTATPRDLSFLLKRASVSVTGANGEASVWIGPLAADPEQLAALWAEEIAAYVDGVALAPGDGLEAAIARLGELDPGKPVALDALPLPDPSGLALPLAADAAARGVAITHFGALGALERADLEPLLVLARELHGDLSYDPYTTFDGAARAWAFVRGEDLGLRIVVESAPGQGEVRLVIEDPHLRDPVRVDLATGEPVPIEGAIAVRRGLQVPIPPGPVAVLRVERRTAAELGGGEERLDVEGERSMPVEEILRRLQAFEDDQARKLHHYQARNILHLRFQAGPSGIEAAYAGDFFFERGMGFDWVWEEFLVGGVKWRSKWLPEIPLIQPEKAAALPLEILFTKEYQYRLRGTATVDGRDTWVVDFRPLVGTAGRALYQGTVWVDRATYSRVRTRAIQLGLEGDVLSNEETTYFTSVDAQGNPAPRSRDSFVLPTRIVSQQLLSILNATVPLETESQLSGLRINDPSFAANREAAWASDLTMVRDTEDGLRYLRLDESGERVVETEIDTDRLFLVGGLFWDESLDYPVPLVGINYLALDFRGTGNQVNLFAAGPLLTVNYAEPRLFESKWDAGVNLFGFFLDRTDEIFREGEEVPSEEIESRTASASFFLGRPLGSFVKLDFGYRLGLDRYSRGDDTAEEFVLPNDGTTHSFSTELRYDRSGYRARVAGSYHTRSDWEPWGLPGSTEFDPEQEDFLRWRASFRKTWWLQRFRTVGLELTHLDGQDLDRFSRYDFGIFGDLSIPGYQGGLVRADRATGAEIGYGLSFGDLLRFEVEGAAAAVTNEATGLDREVLAGVGLEGSLPLPWQLLTNFELGIGVAGPGEGDLAARIVFLKLFGGEGNRRRKRGGAKD